MKYWIIFVHEKCKFYLSVEKNGLKKFFFWIHDYTEQKDKNKRRQDKTKRQDKKAIIFLGECSVDKLSISH